MGSADSANTVGIPVSINYEEMAKSFDQVQPLFGTSTDGLLAHASGLTAGASVLDIACGTGEPGLTLAERNPGVQLLGVDMSEAMIEIARTKAAAKELSDIRFEVMSSQKLTVADESIDVVVSRMGLLSFADPLIEACEVARVLRPGGTLTIATWDAGNRNVLTYAIGSAVREWLPPEVHTMVHRGEEFAMPRRRESWLEKAGFSDVHSGPWSWIVEFPDEQRMWDLATGPAMLGAVLGGLDGEQLAQARIEFRRLLADYRRSDGTYAVPYECRLIWGRR